MGKRLNAAQLGCALQQAHWEAGSERERERDTSALQAKASADNLTYRWKALHYGLFLNSGGSDVLDSNHMSARLERVSTASTDTAGRHSVIS